MSELVGSASQTSAKANIRQQQQLLQISSNNNNNNNSNQQHHHHQVSSSMANSQQQAPMSSPSLAFQQVKQTQASLARLSRVQQQQQQQQQIGQTNQSSQHHQATSNKQDQAPTTSKSTTFVDCLIRRFKDCFSEDFCTVPMFVVGNLSPGSDGTHLILPPCVSLGRQNINRFAGPKNLRLMNSIRESCRSIEELDLGGNKLNDLIEVYKILQCTPNLRFLNLSENDLSRTSPVATSSLANSGSATSPSTSSGSLAWQWPAGSSMASLQTSGQQHQLHQQQQQRNCLAPINQNQTGAGASSGVGARRRHSTLGQSMGSQAIGGARGAPSRLAEARRLAAAAALAQSKKTSPALVASKLAASQSAAAATSGAVGQSKAIGGGGGGGQTGDSRQLRHQQTVQASTMHLARSLSSLSAKDAVRKGPSGHSLSGRLAAAHRKEAGKFGFGRNIGHSPVQEGANSSSSSSTRQPQATGSGRQQAPNGSQARPSVAAAGKPTSQQPLAPVETIAENEMVDVDMANGSIAAAAASGSLPASASQPVAIGQQQQSRSSQQAGSNSAFARSSSSTFYSSTATSSQSPNFRRTFESIKALALNNTGCQWRVVCSILSRMPNLEELHLSLNNYERIDLDPNEFRHKTLKRLYLCNNPKLTNWEELDKLLVAFPSLEALSIADCNISQIPDNLDRAREWRKLCGLNINGWPIKEWPVIERLNQLPSLIDLKCRNLEILNTIDQPRHHLIARLPKLQRLNGSEIEEREDAEKAFLRFFMANSHLERPTRFHELVQIHGEVGPIDVDVDLSPPSQAQVRVIYLNRNYYKKENEDDILMSEDFLIKLMDEQPQVDQQQESLMEMADNNDNADGCSQQAGDHSAGTGKLIRLFKDEGQEVLAIEVDLRQSVRKFKSSLASFFGLDNPKNLILYYIDREMVGLMGPELIKHNQKKLWNYNVQDGDQFIVEER